MQPHVLHSSRDSPPLMQREIDGIGTNPLTSSLFRRTSHASRLLLAFVWRCDGIDRECCRVGPGSCTPSPSQIPDVNLSIHPARVTARRLPPSAEPSGSSRYDPVGPSSTAMTCPLCSTGITPLQRYYEAVRPSPAHRYFRPRGWSRLCFFPWHRRQGSHVPYDRLLELRAAYTPDAARSVSGHPPS